MLRIQEVIQMTMVRILILGTLSAGMLAGSAVKIRCNRLSWWRLLAHARAIHLSEGRGSCGSRRQLASRTEHQVPWARGTRLLARRQMGDISGTLMPLGPMSPSDVSRRSCFTRKVPVKVSLARSRCCGGLASS